MGCTSSGDEIKEKENNPTKKEENIEEINEIENKINGKKNSSKKLYKNNILTSTNNIDSMNPDLSHKEIDSINISKKDKDRTFSSLKKQIEIKINDEENEEENEEEKDENKNKGFSQINNDKTINLENSKNEHKLNIGPINIKDKLSKRNYIKYAILEKDNESEDNSNIKMNINNNLKENKEIYKEPKFKYYISRNEMSNENYSTNLDTIPIKFVRKYTTSPKKYKNNFILGGLLLNEEKNLSLSFENLVNLQTGKPSRKYKVLAVLGNGSYGKVYKAKNIVTDNLVAIKSIKKKKENNGGRIDIENEINVLKKLSHPNIVKIYEFYDIKEKYYLITEFCKYGELYQYLKFNFSEKQLCVLFYQVFSGLIYLHDNNVIHRDLKLENIMIDSIEKDNISCEPYFYIKIIDFGSAKIFSKQKSEKEIIGSSYYMAPEVLKQNYNEKCDTWSVGVVLYMLLTKKAPFNGKNNEVIIEKIEEGNYDRKSKKLMEYSQEVRDLLNNLLEIDVNKRFSAKQALNHSWFKYFNGRALFNNFSLGNLKIILDNLFNFKNYNKIQELVLAFLVHNSPTTEENLTILKIFRYFNTSGNCKLLKEELIEGLYKYKSKKEVDSTVEELFKVLDLNKCGYIEYEEFLTATIDRSKLFTKENLKYAFQFIDKEKSNGIDGKKIIIAFNCHENKVLEAVFNNLIIKVDEDGDGIINFNEFQKLCLS